MLDIFQYIENTNSAATSDEAFLHLQNALGYIGLDRVIYSLMTSHDSIGNKRGHGVLRNYPDEWMNHYISKNYEEIDPVRKYGVQVNGAFLWSELDLVKGCELKKDEKLVMNEAREAKLLDGIGYALHAPRNEVFGMGFASSTGGVELHKGMLSLVTIIATQFHTVFLKFNNKQGPIYANLTAREKEILYWCYKGKSNWTIGEILGISENTIKFHLGNIFKKLVVNNKVTAVLKAINLGLITP
jgi:hypothetical protein